jgi:hypothetical protein
MVLHATKAIGKETLTMANESAQDADVTTSPEPPAPDRPNMEDVRVVYQATLSIYAYEGAQVWTRFSAMLVAHSILIVVIGQLLMDATNPFRFFVKALAGAGFLVSLLWLMITVRGFRYHDIFQGAAKKQEAHLSAPPFVEVTQWSAASWFDYIGWFRTRTITYWVIVLFAALYLLLLYLLFS